MTRARASETNGARGRILLICPQAFLINRGTPLSILIILQAITELGYDVDVVTTHIGEDVEMEHVEVHRIPSIPFLRAMPPGPSFAKFVIMPFMLVCALLLLLRRDYRLIVGLEDGALYGGLLSRLFGKKHVYKLEGLPTDHAKPGSLRRRLLGLYERITFATSEVLLPTLDIEAEYLSARVRDPNKKIVVIEVMPALKDERVDPARVASLRQELELDDEDVVALWIGNLEWYQGASLLRDTIHAMSDDDNGIGRRIKFVVAGKDEELRHLLQDLDSANLRTLEPSIADMPHLVAIADICLSFRNIDVGFPSKVKVFLRAGKAIVAVDTRTHGCHLTDGDNSRLIDFDVDQAIQAIRALAEDECERRRIGENAKRYFERQFSWERYRNCWRTAIEHVDTVDSDSSDASPIRTLE